MIGAEAAALVLSRLIAGQFPSDGESRPSSSDRVEPVELEVEGRPALFRPTATMLQGTRRRTEHAGRLRGRDGGNSPARPDGGLRGAGGRRIRKRSDGTSPRAPRRPRPDARPPLSADRQVEAVGWARETCPVLADLRTIVEETVAELRSIAKGTPTADSRRPRTRRVRQPDSRGGCRTRALRGLVRRHRRRSSVARPGGTDHLPHRTGSPFERRTSLGQRDRVAVGLDFESGGCVCWSKTTGSGSTCLQRRTETAPLARASRHDGTSARDRFPS